MIEFKPVRLEDKQTIERYTMPSGIYNCDLAFANMYCWQAMYRSAWAEIDGFLVIRFQIGGGEKIGYMQPVGEGDFARIIPALREDAHAHGQRLRIIGLTDEGREMVRNMHAGLFAFESDRGMEDYVYNADDLRNLTGRKYQPKRNTSTVSWRSTPVSGTSNSRASGSGSACSSNANGAGPTKGTPRSCAPNSGPCSGLSNISKNWKCSAAVSTWATG